MKKPTEVKNTYVNDGISTVVYMIDASKIIPNPSQPRSNFDINAISKLADSIKRYGLLQPLSVRKSTQSATQYELVAGERRFRACEMLKMTQIPCIVINADEETSAELALIENIIRENLNMFEEARAFRLLSTRYNLTQEEIAARMSLSQSAVANKIRLLKLSDNEQVTIIKSGLTERHARALLRISCQTQRQSALEFIIKNNLNVTDSEKYISSLIVAPREEEKSELQKPPTSEKICASIYRFISKMQGVCGKNLVVNRRSNDKCVVITLTVRK